MGKGNETNFLTEREARPLIQCAGREAGGQSVGRQGKPEGGPGKQPGGKLGAACMRTLKLEEKRRVGTQEGLGASTKKAARKE